MSGVGERQVTGENGRGHQVKKAGYGLNMEGFWLCGKCRIIAVITILPMPFSFSTVIGDVFYPDPKSIKVLGACEQESPRVIVKKRR
jgi:hypothetical protein